MDLKGKIAIVTGASKGIGIETVKALLEKGVKVAGWSRSEPAVKHSDFLYVYADVSDIDSVNAAYDKTIEHFGDNVQILVNNAGLGYAGLLDELKVEEWKKMFDVNVHGLFYCSRIVTARMKALGEGHIINIASIAGTIGTEGFSGYSGTKFAVRGISQSMYKELRDYGVKVTCINPGSVQTNFFDEISNIEVNANMMRPEWIADSIIYVLQTPENYHPVEFEVRPLMPKGRKSVTI